MDASTVAIVLVDFNGLADTVRCLDSLRAARLHNARVIVVDNGSSPPTAPAIAASHDWVTVLRRDQNGGWAGGNNEGIKNALSHGASHVILLNNDTVVAPEFVERLMDAAMAYPDAGIIGPVINAMDATDELMTDGCVFNAPTTPGTFFYRRAVPLARQDPPALTDVDIVNGCCMMVAASVFQRIGLVDERFFLIHEESDLCLRAGAAGIRCTVLGETLVWHKGSSSFRRAGQRHQRYYDARNLLLLLDKHRGRRGRGHMASRVEWLRYLYYRYAFEREHGQDDAAKAVIEGLLDGLAHRFGAYERRRHVALPAVRAVFESARRLSTRSSRATAPSTR